MKLGVLVEQLRRLDPELDVICYTEDEHLLQGGRGFLLLDIVEAKEQEVTPLRLDDGTPYCKFERGPGAERQVLLEVTSDF